jgi:DNA polymerase-3 subunit beta
MKLRLNKTELTLAAMRCHGVILEKTLGYLSLKAEGSKLHILIADRILIVSNILDCEVEEAGEAYVPARLFLDVVRELPEGQVKLRKVGNNLVVQAGHKDEFLIKIPLIEGKQWKDPPSVNFASKASVSTKALAYLVSQTQFCIAHEAARNYGSVGFLHRANNKLRLVGTDGYRLSYAEAEVAMPEDFLKDGICLSKRALLELQRMASEGFENIEVSISDDQTMFLASVMDYSLYVRLSAIKYPNYQGVIPKGNLTKVELARETFQNAAKRVLLASDKTRALQLNFSSNLLTLTSKASGGSEGKEDIYLDDYTGGNQSFSVNGKFLSEVFAMAGGKKVSLNMKNVDDPIVILPTEEPEHCHSLHVLVPIKEA